MIFSLILTGGQRPKDLDRFFHYISAININNFKIQIVFVNQSDYIHPEKFNCELFEYIELKSSPLPLSIARNLGLKSARGDIVVFPDDDCWYSSDVFVQVADYFNSNQEVDCICTNVFDPRVEKSYGGRPIGSCIPINFTNMFELPISVGIFLRRHSFESVGFFFDENIGAGTPLGSGEETELIYRLLKTDSKIVYNGLIKVFHPVPVYQPLDAEKYYRYGLGFGYLNGKILYDKEFRVFRRFCYVIIRSLGGVIFNLTRKTERKIYWNRLLGIMHGLILGFRR